MKTRLRVFRCLGWSLITACLSISLPAQEEQPAQAAVPTRIAEELITVTAKVEAIDVAKRELTLKGPLGRHVTVRVEDPTRLAKLRLDETVVVVCADAVAISVEKVRK